MADYDVTELTTETLFIIVTSTFGNGDPPDHGMVYICIIRNKFKYMYI